MTYGSVELGEIAHQYGQSSFDYKVFDEFAYAEDNKNDCLIITSLRQSAFPMIRYQMEDKAQVVNDDKGAQYLMNLEEKIPISFMVPMARNITPRFLMNASMR